MHSLSETAYFVVKEQKNKPSYYWEQDIKPPATRIKRRISAYQSVKMCMIFNMQ